MKKTALPQLNRWRALGAALAASAALVACGGSDTETPTYSRIVVFGDSLSDVGTYATAGVKAMGGGKYTVNGATSKIWVEQLATRMGVTAPCAAQTGLNATGPVAGLAEAVTARAGCFGYAQGGARITNPVGPGNAALLSLGDSSGALGQLTDPVANQVTRYLASNTSFSADAVVTVLAGANDLFMNLATMNATISAGGDANAAVGAAVTAMTTAGTELATIVNSRIVGNGARKVVVLTVPDVSATPYGVSLGAQTGALIRQMVGAFNTALVNGVRNQSTVLVVDAYATSQAIAAAPAAYGVSNAAMPACDMTRVTTSLFCSAATTLTGVDVSKFQYADGVHPTPFGHELITSAVIARMTSVGWL